MGRPRCTRVMEAGKAATVAGLLKDKKIGEALGAALDGGFDEAAAGDVLKVLTKAKSAEMSPAISSLSPEADDALMRYLYLYLAGNQNSSAVLQWHQCLTEKAGVGCIMRTINAN